MKRQIRKGVFETNSSSTHAICITKNDILDNKSNKVYFELGEFGWEFATLDTILEKASYLYTSIIIRDSITELDTLKKLLNDNSIEYELEDTSHDNYYIDHQSQTDNFVEDVLSDASKLLRFLFSSESFILTGNDNSEDDVEINVDYDHDEY